jgi:hypothetical protein
MTSAIDEVLAGPECPLLALSSRQNQSSLD